MSYRGSSGMATFNAFLGIGVLIFFIACGAANCGDPDPKLKGAVQAQGMTNVAIGDWSPLSCGDDSISRDFKATNTKGEPVKGTICCGLVFKNCTVRW